MKTNKMEMAVETPVTDNDVSAWRIRTELRRKGLKNKRKGDHLCV